MHQHIQKRDFYLDAVRGLAIIMVVAIHAAAYLQPSPPLINFIVYQVFSYIAVPIFFLVDGHLFNAHLTKTQPLHFFNFSKKSFNRLIIPWFCFSTLYFICRFLGEHTGQLAPILLQEISVSYFFYSIYYSIFSGQLYFLLSLFIIRLALYHILNKLLGKPFLTTGLFIFSCILFNYAHFLNYAPSDGYDPITHAVWGAQFYIFGFLLKDIEYQLLFQKYKYWVYVFLCSLLFVFIIFTNDFLSSFHSLIMCLIVFLIAKNHVKKQSWMTFLGEKTMGIYLIHAPILVFIITKAVNKININAEIQFFIAVITLVILSVYTTRVLLYTRIGKRILGS